MTDRALDGKVALITGGGSGIGRAIAIALADAGAAVVIADRDAASAKAVAAEIGRSALSFAMDVSRPDSWQAGLAALMEAFGRLDVLVNNAGVVLLENIETMSLEQWSRVIDTNMGGVFLGLKFATPHMVAGGGGAVVNIASTAGLRGAASASAYAASKAGIISLTKSAARQFAQDGLGIRVNAICPGPVETPAHNHRPGSVAAALGPDEIRRRILASVPMARLGEAAEVAAAARFLVGGEASFITGAVLTIDGGQAA